MWSIHYRRSNYSEGRSLSMVSSSTMQVNPDIPECFDLRGWYDSQGAQTNFHAHSTLNTTTSMGFRHDEVKSLDDVKQAGFGMPDRPEYFSTRATIMHIKSDNLSYPACPTAQCNKKVTEIGGLWRCEKCDKSFEAPEHRYVSHVFRTMLLLTFVKIHHVDVSGGLFKPSLASRLQRCGNYGLWHDCERVACDKGLSFRIFVALLSLMIIINRSVMKSNSISSCTRPSAARTISRAVRSKILSTSVDLLFQLFNVLTYYQEQTRIRYGISRIYPLNYCEEANRLKDLLYSSWAR